MVSEAHKESGAALSSDAVGENPALPGARLDSAAPLLIAALCLVVYSPAFSNSFTSWDDHHTISRNLHLVMPDLASLRYYWTHEYMHLYIPATYTVWWVIAVVAKVVTGVSTPPAWFHGANLALHILATLILYQLLSRLIRDGLAAILG